MFDSTLLIVFFIYGLAFFCLGLTLALEIVRSPNTAEVRVLWPLAIFGLIHGAHEWFESYLIQAEAVGTIIPGWFSWLRVTLLILSFVSLVVYGVLSFQQREYSPLLGMRWGLTLLGIYLAGIITSAILAYRSTPIPWVDFLDVLSRYVIAAPGAFFAALAFRGSAVLAKRAGLHRFSAALRVSMIGFLVYGLVQFIPHSLQMFPASIINTDTFRATFGFPVQILRALGAVVITMGVMRATQLTEKRRQSQLVDAQREKVEALELVQDELTKQETLRRELLRHIVQAQEDERARIARELHDETAQTLAAFSLDLATMQAIVSDRSEYRDMNSRLQTLSRQMSQSLYRLVHDLRPAQLDDLGLVSALQFLADQDASSRGLRVELRVEGEARRLDKTVETVLFRVAQEALNNVARHAHTGNACIDIKYSLQEISMSVTDNGTGFNPRQTFAPPRGWGLMGMRERLEAVGGQLSIKSAPGQGTSVSAVISVFDKIP
jgi:signal transduction histidine kinase